MTNPIWMYWENLPGSVRAPYLNLCLKTIRRHAGDREIRVLDEKSVFEWLPANSDVWSRLPGPAKRSDYARTRLIHQYGGVWLDFDLIATGPLNQLFEPLRREELVSFGREWGGRFYAGLFGAQPGSPIVGEWIRQQDEVLRRTEDWASLSWGALVQEIMWPLAKKQGYFSFPISRIAPVPWFQWRRLLSKWQSPRKALADNPITVMLWNRNMGPILEGVSAEALMQSRTLLGRLFRLALGETSLEQEVDLQTRLHSLSALRFSHVGRSVEIRARRLLGRPA